MKERLQNKHLKDRSGYVTGIKNSIQKRYSNYKMSKVREYYRDGLEFEEAAEYKKAIHNYLACLEIEPRNVRFLRRLANLYSNLEENTKSLELFSKIVKLYPNEESYFNLGQEFYKQNRLKKTIKCLKNSLYYNKRFIKSHILLANLFSKVGNTDKTEQYLSNVLRIDPNHKSSLEELMKCYYKQGRYRDALSIMKQYNSIYIEDTSQKLLESDILTKMGNYAQALKLLHQTTSSEIQFNGFIKEMQFRRMNPTVLEKDFLNRIADIKNKKIVTFKNNLQDYYKEVEGVYPNPKDAFDLSILYLLLGNHKKALKYLLFARQLNEERKYS